MKFNEVTTAAYHGYKLQREFNSSVQSVCSLYSNQIPKGTQLPFRKLYIELHEELEKPANAKITSGEVVVLRHLFNFPAYWAHTELKRKLMILDVLKDSITDLRTLLPFDSKPFELAAEKVKALNFKHQGEIRKPVKSPDRKHSAGLSYDFKTDGIDILAHFYDKQGKSLKTVTILKLLPNDYLLHHAIGKSKWTDNGTFILQSQDMKTTATAYLLEE